MLRRFLLMVAASVATFVVSVILHNAISAVLGAEEPVFFLIAVVAAPVAFMVGVVGSLVVLARRFLARA